MQNSKSELADHVRFGVLPAMATPLTTNGYQVNVDAVSPLVDFLVGAGVKGLFVGGTTGEGILLDINQRYALHEAAAATVSGRVPLLLHVGTNNTRDTLALAAHGADLGVDAIVVITPTFYHMPDGALLTYLAEIAASVPETPLLVYDIPHMAANGVSPALLDRLRQSIPTFAGIKCSRPDAQVIRQLIDVAGASDIVFAGNERIALGSLALGATGLISGLSTAIPEPFVALGRAVASGDLKQARVEQRRINRLLDIIPAGERIGAIKLILAQRGIAAGPPVPPRQMPDGPDLWQRLSALL